MLLTFICCVFFQITFQKCPWFFLYKQLPFYYSQFYYFRRLYGWRNLVWCQMYLWGYISYQALFALSPTSPTPVKYPSVFGISHSSWLKQSWQSFPHQTVCLFWRGSGHRLWFCWGWKEGIAAVRQHRRVKWVSHAAQLPVGRPCTIQPDLCQEKEKPSKPRQPVPLTNPKHPFWPPSLGWK